MLSENRPVDAFASDMSSTAVPLLDELIFQFGSKCLEKHCWRNERSTPVARAANWSNCSLFPATNQRVATKLSTKSKTFPNSPSRRSTEATLPRSHRSSNRRHAT
ncbi:hypothetical protein TNCV_2137771 [Trichonephila clavipes]|nr:hypothetical protein TNCV_2137771 [Trichonephila clavipes]